MNINETVITLSLFNFNNPSSKDWHYIDILRGCSKANYINTFTHLYRNSNFDNKDLVENIIILNKIFQLTSLYNMYNTEVSQQCNLNKERISPEEHVERVRNLTMNNFKENNNA